MICPGLLRKSVAEPRASVGRGISSSTVTSRPSCPGSSPRVVLQLCTDFQSQPRPREALSPSRQAFTKDAWRMGSTWHSAKGISCTKQPFARVCQVCHSRIGQTSSQHHYLHSNTIDSKIHSIPFPFTALGIRRMDPGLPTASWA